jgi:hypothetical protein
MSYRWCYHTNILLQILCYYSNFHHFRTPSPSPKISIAARLRELTLPCPCDLSYHLIILRLPDTPNFPSYRRPNHPITYHLSHVLRPDSHLSPNE